MVELGSEPGGFVYTLWCRCVRLYRLAVSIDVCLLVRSAYPRTGTRDQRRMAEDDDVTIRTWCNDDAPLEMLRC